MRHVSWGFSLKHSLPHTDSLWKGSHHIPFILITCAVVSKSRLTLRNPTDSSTPGFPIICHLPWICSNSCSLSQWCHPVTCQMGDHQRAPLPPKPLLLTPSPPCSWLPLTPRPGAPSAHAPPPARQGCSRPGGPALNPEKAVALSTRRSHVSQARSQARSWPRGAATHGPGLISTPSPHAECKVKSKGPGIAEPTEQNAALNPATGIPDPQKANTRGRKECRASHQAPTWKHIWYWTSLPSTFAWTFHNPLHRPVMTYMQSFVYSLTHVLFTYYTFIYIFPPFSFDCFFNRNKTWQTLPQELVETDDTPPRPRWKITLCHPPRGWVWQRPQFF